MCSVLGLPRVHVSASLLCASALSSLSSSGALRRNEFIILLHSEWYRHKRPYYNSYGTENEPNSFTHPFQSILSRFPILYRPCGISALFCNLFAEFPGYLHDDGCQSTIDIFGRNLSIIAPLTVMYGKSARDGSRNKPILW